MKTTYQDLYPLSTKLLLSVVGLVLCGLGLKLFLFTLSAFYPLVFLLAALLLLLGSYLLLEATKRYSVTTTHFSLITVLSKDLYAKEEVVGFVDVLLPTTKPRRKTRQLWLLLRSGKKLTIHSTALGDKYAELVASLKKKGYPELTRQKAAEIIKEYKTNYRTIGASICGLVSAWATYQFLFLFLTGDSFSSTLPWLVVSLLAGGGILYYLIWSKGYD